MLERRRLGRQVEVVGAGEDEVPVGHVEQRGQRVEPQVDELVGGGEDLGVDGHPEQHHQQGRQQAAGPPGPELPEVDGEALAPLPDQQRGDQEARQHEEHVDGEEAAAEDRRPAVVHHHPEHRQGPQAVEGGDEAEADRTAASPGGRHRGGTGSLARRVGSRAHRRASGHRRAGRSRRGAATVSQTRRRIRGRALPSPAPPTRSGRGGDGRFDSPRSAPRPAGDCDHTEGL